jgi:predicted RNA binding protein YcfA (HicA-like mRNA interferase family)
MGSGERIERNESPSVQASGEAGPVTISGKLSDDLAPGTFNSILKQAGLK